MRESNTNKSKTMKQFRIRLTKKDLPRKRDVIVICIEILGVFANFI